MSPKLATVFECNNGSAFSCGQHSSVPTGNDSRQVSTRRYSRYRPALSSVGAAKDDAIVPNSQGDIGRFSHESDRVDIVRNLTSTRFPTSTAIWGELDCSALADRQDIAGICADCSRVQPLAGVRCPGRPTCPSVRGKTYLSSRADGDEDRAARVRFNGSQTRVGASLDDAPVRAPVLRPGDYTVASDRNDDVSPRRCEVMEVCPGYAAELEHDLPLRFFGGRDAVFQRRFRLPHVVAGEQGGIEYPEAAESQNERCDHHPELCPSFTAGSTDCPETTQRLRGFWTGCRIHHRTLSVRVAYLGIYGAGIQLFGKPIGPT